VSGVDPQPGDLLFSAGSDGTPDNPGHVAMYVGNGRMIDAKGVRWGVVESALTDAAMSRVIAVVRPLAAT
jgi:cell wall-associated NlpC family hydrolase